MPPRRKLNDLDRGRAIGWLAVAPSVIIRLKQRFHATGRVQERQGSGRSRVTTQREDRFTQRQAMQQRMATANNIRQRLQATTNTVVSGQTIRNRLHKFGLRARRPVRGTTLTTNHRAARRAWCTQHVKWQRQQWAQVLFTDESRFCLEPADGRIRVWRCRGERFAEDAVLERQRFGGGSVMVWGGISTRLRTPLYHVVGNLTGVRYQNEILQPLVVPALKAIGPRAILQDDNAPPHRSAAVNTFIQQARVNRMLWPANIVSNSPDLNPIEHMWDELCRRAQQHHPPPANLGQLLQWLQQEWNEVPRAFICNLIHSMRQRCVECLAHNGGHTRY
ncbi:hypothetical protein V1264_011806 [Littorina saxatilis]|uniref:Transposase n=1 Tax=Littorina saxatilis TaxID=31220 RepID=A0AAN9GKX1_9CAEN